MNIDNQLFQLECQKDAINCIQYASSSGCVGEEVVSNALYAVYSAIDSIHKELSKIADESRKAGAVNE